MSKTLWGITSAHIVRVPRGLASSESKHVGGRRDNLMVERAGDGRHLYCCQRMQLKDHLLLIVRHGYLRLKIEGVQLTVQAGSAVLLSDLEFEVSELISPGEGGASFSWLFFDDSILGGPAGPPISEFLHLQNFVDHPSSHKVMLYDAIEVRGIESLSCGRPELFLQRLLNASFNNGYPPLLKLLMRRVVVPRLRVWLFVENLVFLDKPQRRQFCESYPGGARALGRELGRLGYPSVDRLIARRRGELRHEMRRRGLKPVAKLPIRGESGQLAQSQEEGLHSLHVDRATLSGSFDPYCEPPSESEPDPESTPSQPLPLSEEQGMLRLLQKEQVLEVMNSKVVRFPEIKMYAEMLMAA